MIAKLDGLANDGSPGEVDAVAGDFEDIEGSPANDSLTGSSDSNIIWEATATTRSRAAPATSTA